MLLLLLGMVACSASKKSTTVPNKLPQETEKKEPEVSNADKRKQEAEIARQKYPDLPAFENDFNVAILLPLYLNVTPDPSSSEYQLQMSVLDYYQGILLALDSLKKEGINIHVHVFDTQRDSLLTVKIISKLEGIKLDLIIGPLDASSFRMVSDFSNRNTIPLIAPFSMPDEKNKLNNPYAFFCSPSLKSYGKRLGTYLAGVDKPLNVIYLSDTSDTDKAFYSGFMEVMNKEKLPVKKMKINSDMNVNGQLIKLGKDSTVNIVVIPTDIEQKATAVVKTLKGVDMEQTHVKIVGLDSWDNFKTPDYQHWDRMNLMVLSNYYEGPDSCYQRFYYLYREKFTVPPTSLSLRGFDQTLFFGRALLTFGRNFPKYVQNTDFSATHNHFFWNYSGNVVQNESVNLLQFYEFRFFRVE